MQRYNANGKIVDILDDEPIKPIQETDELGDHPVSTIVGSASGAATATLAGAALGGPAGAVAGAVFGAVAGGLAGNEIAEAVNPTTMNDYKEMGREPLNGSFETEEAVYDKRTDSFVVKAKAREKEDA